jgi:hypothetical protein
LERLIKRARPLFVASEIERNEERSVRARKFNDALKAVCAQYEIMILCVERHSVDTPRRGRRPVTNHDIAEAAARHFPLIADKLPRRRRIWDGSDDRIGVLLAAAIAVAGWNHFSPSRKPGDISASAEKARPAPP